jgi:hypothetical protein
VSDEGDLGFNAVDSSFAPVPEDASISMENDEE